MVTTYDRSQLIDRAIDNLGYKLLEEFIVVALVCALFLWHVRSALVAIIAAARPVLRFYHDAFPGAQRQHHVAGRDRHCGGGAMVDAAIVMIENAHKRLEEETSAPERS